MICVLAKKHQVCVKNRELRDKEHITLCSISDSYNVVIQQLKINKKFGSCNFFFYFFFCVFIGLRRVRNEYKKVTEQVTDIGGYW